MYQKMNGQPMPWQEAARLLIPIARALDYAHKRNLIHRDIKPSNILITESGEPMLTDFGVAKIIDEEVTLDLTGTSAAVGTPEYMAPEQAISKNVDHRADIYALGIVFYEMVTGRRPFQADTPLAVLFKQASEPLPRPTLFVSNLPDSVEKILLKALAKRPEDRYQGMGEVVHAMESLVSGVAPAVKQQPAQPVRPPERRLDTQATINQDEDKTVEDSPALDVQKASVESVSIESKLISPSWLSVFWIVLSWAISGAVSGVFANIGIYIEGYLFPLVFAVGGFGMAFVLLRTKALSSWKEVFWITLGWAIGWFISGIILRRGFGYITIIVLSAGTYAIGGFVMAVILFKAKTLTSRKNIFWITLGWTIGGAVLYVIGNPIYEIVENDMITWILIMAIIGTIGGTITIWRLRAERKNR